MESNPSSRRLSEQPRCRRMDSEWCGYSTRPLFMYRARSRGGKIKPDVVAFGGCENSPIHAVSMTPGHKVSTQGTSFSTPLVSSLVGQAIGGVDRGSALLARAMVVHSANHPSGKPDHEFGHGAALKILSSSSVAVKTMSRSPFRDLSP